MATLCGSSQLPEGYGNRGIHSTPVNLKKSVQKKSRNKSVMVFIDVHCCQGEQETFFHFLCKRTGVAGPRRDIIGGDRPTCMGSDGELG